MEDGEGGRAKPRKKNKLVNREQGSGSYTTPRFREVVEVY